jgi:hypothetical protein
MTTTKITITDIQRTVLEAAAAREGGYVWPLPEALGLKKGSAVLVVKALIAKRLVKERRARADEPVWRDDVNDKPMTALITRAGLNAVGGAHLAAAPEAHVDAEPRRMPRAGSKLAILVTLLGRDEGATVEEMVAATAWQAHTVRGVMSGTLKKKFGLTIASEKVEERGRTYRISWCR